MEHLDLNEVLQQFYQEDEKNSNLSIIQIAFLLNYSLSKLTNLKFESSPKNIKKIICALILIKLQRECPKGVDYSKLLNYALILLELAPEHVNAIINCCDKILISELADAKNTNEILHWCLKGAMIQKRSGKALDGMKLGYSNFVAFMWNQFSEIFTSPSVENILNAMKDLHVSKVKLEFPCLDTFILGIGRAALEYIGIENIKIDIESARKILQATQRLELENIYFENDFNALKKKIDEKESLKDKSGLETGNIFEMDFSTIENDAIENITSSCVKKIDPPMYAVKTTYFQVCIYKAIYNNNEVAVKMYQPVHPNTDWNKIYKEIQIYQKLSSIANNQNCFLKYYGTYVDQNSINMVMEYYPDNLMKYLTHLKNENYKFEQEELIGPIFYKLLSSFKIMKDIGIFHSDIKPHNFLVDEHWNIKIIDFSISMIKNEDITTTATGQFPIQGIEGYTAPEIEEARLNKELSANFNPEKADVFSLGLVFLQMLTYENVKGFNTKSSHQCLFEKVNTITIVWAKMLIINMLEFDPSTRKNFTELLSMVPISATQSLNRT